MIGLPAVLSRLAALGAEIEHEAVPEGLEAAGEHLKTAWQTNIAAEGFVEYTGHYHDSIQVAREGDEVKVFSDAPYASILEFGDSRQAAHPVAERAADENHAEVSDKVGDAIRKKIG